MSNVVVRNIKRTDAGLVKRLGVLGVATAHEAYGRNGLMKPYMRPVWQGGEAAGTAVTGTLSVIESTDLTDAEPSLGFPTSFSDFHDFAYAYTVGS